MDFFARSRSKEKKLLAAIEDGRAEAVENLLSKGADANVRDEFHGFTALISAAIKGHDVIV